MIWFDCPVELSADMIKKGSITVDGVSLTLVDVRPGGFQVMLIPHTLAVTTLGTRKVGEPVNIEVDILARYVRNALANMAIGATGGPKTVGVANLSTKARFVGLESTCTMAESTLGGGKNDRGGMRRTIDTSANA